MRKAVLVGMVSCLLGFGSLVSAGEVRVGFVNLQRIKGTDEWNRLTELFKTEVGKSQLEVEQRRRELEAAALQYERQKLMLSEDAQRERERELQKQKLEFQLWAQDRQKDLEKRQAEMTQQIWSRVMEVVERISKEKKLNFVIDYNPDASKVTVNFEKGFIYLAPEMDITDEVIREFNALFGSSS